MTQKCCDCWALTSVPGSSFLLGDIALSTATLQLPSRAVMADVYWKHGSQGFELRVSTRLTEVVVQSTRATSSIDVAFLDGLDESHVPPSPTPTEPSDTDGGAAAAAADVIVYSPIIVRVKVFFEDEGVVTMGYNVDSHGQITTVGGGGNVCNLAKGLGKGYRR